MACTSCSQTTSSVCKVCALLDGDESIKQVKYCDFCNVHICASCEGNIVRRFDAFKKAKVGKLKDAWNALIEKWRK